MDTEAIPNYVSNVVARLSHQRWKGMNIVATCDFSLFNERRDFGLKLSNELENCRVLHFALKFIRNLAGYVEKIFIVGSPTDVFAEITLRV